MVIVKKKNIQHVVQCIDLWICRYELLFFLDMIYFVTHFVCVFYTTTNSYSYCTLFYCIIL